MVQFLETLSHFYHPNKQQFSEQANSHSQKQHFPTPQTLSFSTSQPNKPKRPSLFRTAIMKLTCKAPTVHGPPRFHPY